MDEISETISRIVAERLHLGVEPVVALRQQPHGSGIWIWVWPRFHPVIPASVNTPAILKSHATRNPGTEKDADAGPRLDAEPDGEGGLGEKINGH